ncbi:hypothetical protein GCM10009665_67800 [Kitasatospora nipponensis]|uniref:L,D-TPase catalytic domain-containing protein n=1 Tax=Kitasatospora nipponensis TaxID=258049 RepID=A0ABP4HJA8_9ACTN
MSGSHRASSQRRRSAGPPSADLPGGADAPGPRQLSRGRRRKARKRRGALSATSFALLMAGAAGWFGFGPGGVLAAHGHGGALPKSTPDLPPTTLDDVPAPADGTTAARPDTGGISGASASAAPSPAASGQAADGSYAALPGLGAAFTARIPAETSQVVLATGANKNSSDTTVTLWTRTPDGRWHPGATWAAHNGYSGWTTDHNVGDLRSPIGVFTLSDAGGLKADPGSKLPYHQDSDFVAAGKGFTGETLAGSFDYVIAINYNRVPGSSPLDTREPLGSAKGGGIWIHADHGGPTHACVSVSEEHMAELVRTLDPAAHPVIVMGDAASLAA